MMNLSEMNQQKLTDTAQAMVANHKGPVGYG